METGIAYKCILDDINGQTICLCVASINNASHFSDNIDKGCLSAFNLAVSFDLIHSYGDNFFRKISKLDVLLY